MNHQGFSIIEMLFVLIITGIILFIAIPDVKIWMSNLTIESEVNDIHSIIQSARFQAVKEKKDIVIQFNHEKNEYLVYMDINSNEKWDEHDDILIKKTGISKKIDLYEAKFGGGKNINYTRFDNKGFCKRLGHVYLKNNHQKFMGVKIKSYAGSSVIIKSSDNGKSWK